MDDEWRCVTERNLRRIADTLGITVEDLFAEARIGRPSSEEVGAMLSAFEAVRDPEDRKRCLALVRAAAKAGPARDDPENAGSFVTSLTASPGRSPDRR